LPTQQHLHSPAVSDHGTPTDEEYELVENCLNALESFISYSPEIQEMTGANMCALLKDLMVYDPNYYAQVRMVQLLCAEGKEDGIIGG
jgi:hypothetical protein